MKNSPFKELKLSKTKCLVFSIKPSAVFPISVINLSNNSSILRVYQPKNMVCFLTLLFILHPSISYVRKSFQLFLQSISQDLTSCHHSDQSHHHLLPGLLEYLLNWSLCSILSLSLVFFEHISQSDPFKVEVRSC